MKVLRRLTNRTVNDIIKQFTKTISDLDHLAKTNQAKKIKTITEATILQGKARDYDTESLRAMSIKSKLEALFNG